jgi:ABC-type maltose transport system permease subunit
MNKHETTLFVLFLPFYFTAFGLYHFMIFSVNNRLRGSEKIPHSLFWRGWNRVKNEHNRLHPRSFVYQLTVTYAVVVVLIAMALLALRSWGYTHGRLP